MDACYHLTKYLAFSGANIVAKNKRSPLRHDADKGAEPNLECVAK